MRLSPSLSNSWLAGGFFLLGSTVFLPGLVAGGVPKWLVLYAAAAVAVLAWRRVSIDLIVLLGGLFVGYAALSLLWSPDPDSGVLQLHKLGIIAVLFLAARAWGHDWDLPVLAAITVPAILILAMVEPGYSGGFGNQNFAAHFLLAICPFLAVFLWRYRTRVWSWLPLFGVGVYLFGFNESRLEYLILWAALFVFCLRHRGWDFAAMTILAALALVLLTGAFTESLAERAELWMATGAMWLDAPLFGQGFGAFGYEYPRFAQAYLVLMPAHESFITEPYFAGAAHNEPLQLLAELGAVGAFLGALFLAVVFLPTLLSFRAVFSINGAEIVSLGILAVLCLVSFPLQNPATAVLAAVCLGRVAGPAAAGIPVSTGLSWLLRGGMAVAVVGGLYLGSLELRGHMAYGQVAAALPENPLAAFRANLRAREIYPWDWQIRHQLYRSFVQMAATNEVNIEMKALDRIYRVSASASPHDRFLKRIRLGMEF